MPHPNAAPPPNQGRAPAHVHTQNGDVHPSLVEQIAKALAILVETGQVAEIRAPKAMLPGATEEKTLSCLFTGESTERRRAAREAEKFGRYAPAVYFTLNPIKSGLRIRSASDKHIDRRRLLLVDCDPIRPVDVSSTDDEKAAALAKALAVREYLRLRGWPEPILTDSGNGYHLLYQINLPADDEGLVKAVLEALARRFDDDACKVDTTVFNPSRVCKLPGTEARKGEPTAERPHRLAAILEVPDERLPVPTELLHALVSDLAPAPVLDLAAEIDRKRKPTCVKGGGPTPEDRAIAYLNRCEPAISGQLGHNKTFKVACKVGPGFNLPEEVAFRLILTHYSPRCDPPWSEKEARHKIKDAYAKEERRGWLLDAKPEDTTHRTNGKPDRPLPKIIITTKEHEVIDAAVAALRSEPAIYQRCNSLVMMSRDKSPARGMVRPAGSPRIVPIPPPLLRKFLSANIAWSKEHKTRNGDYETIPAHPPEWAVSAIAHHLEWPGIRHAEAIIEAPALRPDGSIIDRPGWDEATGLIYEPGADFPAIPTNPTPDDARDARDVLLDLVVDFPFKALHHRAAWLAGLITPFARFAIAGPCPLFQFDANTSGSGKTKLCDLIAIVNTGRPMARTAYPENEDEMRKRISSIALAGDRLMLIDNVGSTFGGSSLDAALTSTSWKDRILGRSEMTAELPLFAVWYATGNNMVLRGDMVRRLVPVRLETTEERPEERSGFTVEGDLLAHASGQRPRLVAAALTILRAYVVAGRPRRELTPMDYTAWSDLVRSAVHWVMGDVDPCAGRKELRDADPETQARAAFLEGWAELQGSAKGVTIAAALRQLRDAPQSYAVLRDTLMEWSRNAELPGARSVGMRLNAMKGRVAGGRAIYPVPGEHNTNAWRVECVRGD